MDQIWMKKLPRKAFVWVEMYNLKDTEDNNLAKCLQNHASEFMRIGRLKFSQPDQFR